MTQTDDTIHAGSAHGSYETVDGRPLLRFERRLAHPIDAVWRAVSDPAELAHWFPSTIAVEELRVGGSMTFSFEEHDLPPMQGSVTELDPPRLLGFSWGDDELRFELAPSDDGAQTTLRFSVALDARDKAARDATGWHVCLDALERQLGGVRDELPSTGVTPDWRERYEQYVASGMPSGAPIPGTSS